MSSKIPIKWVVGETAWWVDPYNGDDPREEVPPRFEPRIGCHQAEIVALDDTTVTLKRLDDDEVFAFPRDGSVAENYAKAEGGRSVDLPKAAERDDFFPPEGYMNMTELRKLNDAELDRNLRMYHAKDHPYCYCGNTLVALNLRTQENGKPLVDTRPLYTDEAKERYAHKKVSDHDVEPHVYAIADSCYRNCFDAKVGPYSNGGSQAMVITGESGAGKSYNTKCALGYLAYVGKDPDAPPGVPVTTKMVKCNDILEAFGNASMPRNPDSSRFGKLFQIFFDSQRQCIKGCNITTYLLEKSRITMQGTNERNYHIFYMICAAQHLLEQPVVGADGTDYGVCFPNAVAELGLLNKEAYRHLNQDYDRLPNSRKPGVNDPMYRCALRATDQDEIDGFADLLLTFREAQFAAGDVEEIMRIMAFCLTIGNVDFLPDPKCDEYAIIDPKSRQHLEHAAKVLRVPIEKLEKSLLVLTRDPTKPQMASQLNVAKAEASRHTLARNIYNDLFMEHIVDKIQGCLLPPGVTMDGPGADPKICILDIFGFEFTPDKKLVSDNPNEGMPLMRNSLEQYCINWCNEALQGLFIDCVVNAEEAFYQDQLGKKVGIDISELDNTKTLEMIQATKGDSIFVKLKDAGGGAAYKADRNETSEMKIVNKMKAGANGAANKDLIGRKILEFPTHLNNPQGKAKISMYLGKRAKQDKAKYPADDLDHVFQLKHYAGVVTYSMFDWVAKDSNKVTYDMKDCLYLAESHPSPDDAFTTNYYKGQLAEAKKGPSLISAAFKTNMAELIAELSSSYCWFTRCIKPCNKQDCEKVPPFNIMKKYEGYKVLDQLRYTGMLDSLTIRKIGYASRMYPEEFVLKYKILCTHLNPGESDAKVIVDWILKQPWYEQKKSPFCLEGQGEDIRIGKDVIMMRDSLDQALSDQRDEMLYSSAIVIRAIYFARTRGEVFSSLYRGCVGGGRYKDLDKCGPGGMLDVVYKQPHALGLCSALRGTLDRLNYYRQKHAWLQRQARTPIAELLRAQLSRMEYLKKRNALFEATNRQLMASWVGAAVCRQAYYERKMAFLEGARMAVENQRMAQMEVHAQQYMAQLEDQQAAEHEERQAMRLEELYAEGIADALFLGTLNLKKERLLLTASEQMRRAQDSLLRLRACESQGSQLDESIEASQEAIELGAHLKVQQLLLEHLPASLAGHGSCDSIRAPEVDSFGLTADALPVFPEEKKDLGVVRRYVYSTNAAYRHMMPSGPPKRASPSDLDEGYTSFTQPVDQSEQQPVSPKHRDSEEDVASEPEPVSYTHLTLPTKRIVEISVVAVSLKKKKKQTSIRTTDKR
eukprot:TRINITY_DN6216_c0_g1_i3.p1 TRINITY_DN6216_c0_g1~~TRINITY_DN6216_c0_g1_i3.p1  ORF type:complete len:1326 (-),score=425.50 TRINITY_DN6216_c0_g1_i3:75-4052(-)